MLLVEAGPSDENDGCSFCCEGETDIVLGLVSVERSISLKNEPLPRLLWLVVGKVGWEVLVVKLSRFGGYGFVLLLPLLLLVVMFRFPFGDASVFVPVVEVDEKVVPCR